MPISFASNAKLVPPGFADRLALFLDVAASGSFSAAGRNLGLAPSSVARQIAELEKQTGAPLLHRSTRALTLTETGELLRERAGDLLRELAELRETVAATEGAPRGLLRITVPVAFGNLHLVPILRSFLARYVEVNVELHLDDALVDFARTRFDLAVRAGNIASDLRLIGTTVAPMHRVLCAAPSYLERHGTPRQPEDLRAHDCLSVPGAAPPGWWQFGGERKPQRIGVSGRLSCNSSQFLLQAAIDGLGIVHLTSWLVGDAIRARRLVRLFPAMPLHEEGQAVQVLRVPGPITPKARVFIEHLRSEIGSPPYWDRDLN
jgi:DNA-binding transcriptional LysR family regulator